jgi:hypothetical protein
MLATIMLLLADSMLQKLGPSPERPPMTEPQIIDLWMAAAFLPAVPGFLWAVASLIPKSWARRYEHHLLAWTGYSLLLLLPSGWVYSYLRDSAASGSRMWFMGLATVAILRMAFFLPRVAEWQKKGGVT